MTNGEPLARGLAPDALMLSVRHRILIAERPSSLVISLSALCRWPNCNLMLVALAAIVSPLGLDGVICATSEPLPVDAAVAKVTQS
jgi:hypothetical protein